MAKSNLDMKGAKPVKLELDFLRLAYAVQKDDSVEKGYLMVSSESIKTRTQTWNKKYSLKGEVGVLVAQLSQSDLKLLEAEKANNSEGILKKDDLDLDNKKSIAKMGKSLLEKELKLQVESREGSLEETNNYPLGIRWDYCGSK